MYMLIPLQMFDGPGLFFLDAVSAFRLWYVPIPFIDFHDESLLPVNLNIGDENITVWLLLQFQCRFPAILTNFQVILFFMDLLSTGDIDCVSISSANDSGWILRGCFDESWYVFARDRNHLLWWGENVNSRTEFEMWWNIRDCLGCLIHFS